MENEHMGELEYITIFLMSVTLILLSKMLYTSIKQSNLRDKIIKHFSKTPLADIDISLAKKLTELQPKMVSESYIPKLMERDAYFLVSRLYNELFVPKVPPETIYNVFYKLTLLESTNNAFFEEVKKQLIKYLSENNTLDVYSKSLDEQQKDYANRFLVPNFLEKVTNTSNTTPYTFR